MRRISLAILGLVLLLLPIPVSRLWFKWTDGALASRTEKQVVENLMWGQARSTGRSLALSRNDEAFNFFDVGDLSPSSLPLVKDVLNRLSTASGVRIARDKGSSIAIFHDTNVFTRLKSDRPAFRVMGLPDHIIDFLAEKARDDTAHCLTMTRTDDDMNIVLTVVLSSRQDDFHHCLVGGLLNSFGIRSGESVNESELLSVCVLYEARRMGVRDRQHLSRQAELRDKCLQRPKAG